MKTHPRIGLRHPERQPVQVPVDGRDHRARTSREIRRLGISERPARARTFRWSRASSPSPTCSTRWSSERPYKQAWPLEDGIEFLKSQRGRHFDPRCVDAFLADRGRMQAILDEFGD